MKKRLFVMLAAMFVLAGMSANAQVKNDNPQRVDGETSIRGDVNEDGIVDVADINAIIEIMKSNGTTTYYFSVGTTEVTTSNYTTANNATTTIPTTTTFSTTVRGYGYILAPSNKTVTVVNNANNNEIPITEQTSILISGHKVYKTNGVLSVGGTIKITLS
ncbi:MAG: hypothetical protein IKP91_00820 [Bacteroidaceae bacterium]|nr:hypothetical protein [Bacteroidaceae bacterium]